MKRKSAPAELETRRPNDEENFRLVGFRIVRSWERMLDIGVGKEVASSYT